MRFLRRSAPPAEPPRFLVVGLGNPGPEYRNTRHNIGFQVIDLLAERHRIPVRTREARALVGAGAIAGVPVLLAKPQTYMNLSGESVAPLLRRLGLRPESLIVIVDDIDLPTGRVRVRPGGSAGGHNGLKSLIQHLRTEAFPRVRVGVGRPREGRSVVDHVLSPFEREELEPIRQAVARAADAVETILTEGLEVAMSRFNAG